MNHPDEGAGHGLGAGPSGNGSGTFKAKRSPPYRPIADALLTGDVVPFLGAGASSAMHPDAAVWKAPYGGFLPTGAQLSRKLAEELSLSAGDDLDDLAKVSSFYASSEAGRPRLRKRLRSLLNYPVKQREVHEVLAGVAKPMVCVVTNYDTLLEQAFDAAEKPYDLVVYQAESKEHANAVLHWKHKADRPTWVAPNKLKIDLKATSVIYKMHGTIAPSEEWDSFVITEQDYLEFLSRMTSKVAIPSILLEYFRERSFLFLGYSLRDWNLRLMLYKLAQSGSHNTAEAAWSWAIQRQPSELDEELWRSRKLRIYDVDIDSFVAGLREGLKAVRVEKGISA